MDSLSTTASPTRTKSAETALLLNSTGASAAPVRNEAIIREPECRRISGLSRSTRWRLEREGKFPRRRRISPGASGWLASEIAAWLADRAAG
jgi:prophage regulatory protein